MKNFFENEIFATLTENSLKIPKSPMDYKTLMGTVESLINYYPFLSLTYIGTSVLGRGIPMLTLGDNGRKSKSVLYVGCHHGAEHITTNVLLEFIRDCCEAYRQKKKIYGINIEKMLKHRTVYIVPQLNVDGADININGADNTLLRERLIKINGGDDFSLWQANARGVDLNHNYDAGFDEYKALETEKEQNFPKSTKYSGEYALSEPESSAVASFIEFSDEISAVMTLHTQGEEIYYTSGGVAPFRSRAVSGILSRMTGYTLAYPEGSASYGGLTDWCIRKLNLPSFTLECGKGINPLPICDSDKIYSDLHEALFTFPILF